MHPLQPGKKFLLFAIVACLVSIAVIGYRNFFDLLGYCFFIIANDDAHRNDRFIAY